MKSEDDERPVKTPSRKVRMASVPGWAGCKGKIKFPNRKTATRASLGLLRQGKGHTRMYSCGGHYHLTSQV